MNMLKGNAVVGQSGGPTAAINATLAGVILGAKALHSEGVIDTLYGMKNGIEGFLEERLVDLLDRFKDDGDVELLKNTPAAALGSCRKKLKSYDVDGETYAKLLSIFKKYNIRYFFYIGGNDSMDTVLKLSEYANAHDYEMRVVGVPKTIDNDLAATDHTPGFGSAAKFVAATVKEILADIDVYTMKAVTIVEIMGRDAGWLTASAALAGVGADRAPSLIYLPEKVFYKEKFLADVKKALEEKNAVLVAASEGIRFEDGSYVGEDSSGKLDAFGHKQLSGVGKVLEGIVKAEIGCKVRSIELNLPQRCAAHLASKTDIDESVRIGAAAVRAAADGNSGVMMIFVRADGEYSVTIEKADISKIANAVRSVPDEYINDECNGITESGIDYLLPLISGEVTPVYENGLPKHIIIRFRTIKQGRI